MKKLLTRAWKNESGFTLMELIIVIVILGILALIAVPRLIGFTDEAEKAADKEYAAVVARAAELRWAANNKTAPADIDELVGANLVDAPELQYYDSVTLIFGAEGDTIDGVSAEGVAEVELSITDGETISYTTMNGYVVDGGQIE